MLTTHIKRAVDAAVDELKRGGFQVLILMLEKSKDDEQLHSMEVLCSETNNPLIIAEMAREALKGLSQSGGEDHQSN